MWGDNSIIEANVEGSQHRLFSHLHGPTREQALSSFKPSLQDQSHLPLPRHWHHQLLPPPLVSRKIPLIIPLAAIDPTA